MLAVGVLPTVATRVLPKAALAFARAVPGACLRASTGPNRFLLSQLRDGSLDLVVGRLAAPDEMAGLVFEQLYSEAVVAVVRAGHPLLAAPGGSLAAWPLILPPPDAIIRQVVEQHFLSTGLEVPRPQVETVSLALGRGLVQASDAVWFISRGRGRRGARRRDAGGARPRRHGPGRPRRPDAPLRPGALGRAPPADAGAARRLPRGTKVYGDSLDAHFMHNACTGRMPGNRLGLNR